MVALILVGSSSFCEGESSAYKVRDSNEEYTDPGLAKYAKSFAPDDSSGAYYGAGFHFPDFFNDGSKNGDTGDFGFGSPFPSLSESRSSDTSYIVPAGTYQTAYNRPKTHVSSHSPVARSHSPVRGAPRKNPILTLYDDWHPDDQPRHKWNDQSRNTKWSQEHTDDDSGEASPTPYKGQLSGPYRGTGSYSRPYSEASLKQHYKPINPSGKTHLPGQGDVRTHAHKYATNHVYDRKKKPEEPYYDQYDDNLNNRKPQQFSSDPNPHQKPYRPSQNEHRSQSYPKEYRSQSYPKQFQNRNFSPSPPDFFRSSKNFDFFTDSSNTAPTKVKTTVSDSTEESRPNDRDFTEESRPNDHSDESSDESRPNDHLDKSCEKSNKSTTINLSDGKISLQCYDCYDRNHKRPYEQCIEVPDEGRSDRKKRSVKSGSVAQAVPARGKRQHDDYYDGDRNYGPDSSDYRFGPEHFADDYPSYDDGEEAPDYDSEKCYKSRKGDMLCISCENKNTGGTYQQCSYASDPKKNSYERSVSKAFGSPRLPDENRRKQVDVGPRRAPKRTPLRARGESDPSSPGYPREASSYDGVPLRTLAKKKVPGESSGGNGQTRYRGSQGRSPLPPSSRHQAKVYPEAHQGMPRDRSFTKTPASTSLKGSRLGLESNLKILGRSSSPKRHPPPASRAYSTPSPIGPDPYSYDLPDPYNPDSGNHGSRKRKNIDVSYEPGYDEAFADLFPELVDTDPSSAVALAPPSYDEYPEEYTDYDDVPVRRRDQDQNGSKIHSTPSTKIPENTTNPEPKKQKICKRVRKNKMVCLQCVDEKGAKQEECSYGTDPKSKHLMYREVKEMRYEPGQQSSEKVKEDSNRSKRKFKKYNPEESYAKNTNLEPKIDGANDRNDRSNNTVPPYRRNSPHHRKETREKREDLQEEKIDAEIDNSTRKNYNPIPTDPPELDNFGEMSEDGEFSADTEVKFDPVLGMSLPKYMLDKSEGEAIFDEVLASSYKDE